MHKQHAYSVAQHEPIRTIRRRCGVDCFRNVVESRMTRDFDKRLSSNDDGVAETLIDFIQVCVSTDCVEHRFHTPASIGFVHGAGKKHKKSLKNVEKKKFTIQVDRGVSCLVNSINAVVLKLVYYVRLSEPDRVVEEYTSKYYRTYQ